MADVVITMKIMPESPEVDFDELTKEVLAKIKEFTGMENYKTELVPMAFGLKALNIVFVSDEAKGSTDSVEEKIAAMDTVASVEITDVRRAIG